MTTHTAREREDEERAVQQAQAWAELPSEYRRLFGMFVKTGRVEYLTQANAVLVVPVRSSVHLPIPMVAQAAAAADDRR
jgi:hypothetical protein